MTWRVVRQYDYVQHSSSNTVTQSGSTIRYVRMSVERVDIVNTCVVNEINVLKKLANNTSSEKLIY
jgi:hypothetical protein